MGGVIFGPDGFVFLIVQGQIPEVLDSEFFRLPGTISGKTRHDLYKSLGCTDMCNVRVFDRSKVKIPVIVFGTAGFSARRDGRYVEL